MGTAVTTTTDPGASSDASSPAFLAPAYAVMSPRWKLCRDVALGTEAVRAAENLDEYFPRGGAETEEEQTARSKRAEFFPMFKETVKGLTGLVFRKDPQLKDDVPAPIRALAENIDGAGTALPVFAKRVFADGMTKGHAGILIDLPAVSTSKPLTIAQERALGIRPYWIHIKAEQIVNWRTATVNGNVVLTLLVLSEITDVPLGEFGTATITRYRVFRRDLATSIITWEIWEQSADDQRPQQTSDGVVRNAVNIPFVAFYAGERLAPLQSVPPLIDLAYTNIAHVQVLSDHRTSMHAAGNPILVIKGRNQSGGMSQDPNRPTVTNEAYLTDGPGAGAPAPEAIVTGPNVGIEVDKDGDVTYAEHTGAALNASATELGAIQDRAAAQGLAMLNRASAGVQTAEAEHLQRNEKDASLSSAARSMEDALEIALAFTAMFMGLQTGGSVEIDREFDNVIIDTPRMLAFSQATAAGQFTLETFWDLMIRGGALPPDFDKAGERRKLDLQGGVTLSPTADGATPDGTDTTPADDTGGGEPPENGDPAE